MEKMVLEKPIVIPRVCFEKSKIGRHRYGLPYIRAYAPYLDMYGISPSEFLEFVDSLNIALRGHDRFFKWIISTGKVVHLVGHFDPTQITKGVGLCIQLFGGFCSWGSCEGPLSKQAAFLRGSNKILFHPRGLKAVIVSTKELKKMLGLHPKQPVMAPLSLENAYYHVPAREDLIKGQRSWIRVPQRQLMAIQQYVSPIILERETSGKTYANTRKRKEAKNVAAFQTVCEINYETYRGKAIQFLRDMMRPGMSEKEWKSGMKKVKNADKEVAATENSKWLVIKNL